MEHLPRELWHAENLTISPSKDMAWVVFWVLISKVSIARHSGILQRQGSGDAVWVLTHVHCSSPVALSSLEVPKKLAFD